MPKISIIIRTKNEEDWISHCLEMVFKQNETNFEVIIVDNESTDHTVKIAERFPVKKVLNVKNYLPGDALNRGIRASSGDFIVCLSAHCVPKDETWLSCLLSNFHNNLNIVGVYGRQLPVSYTDPQEKRDLLITFGRDKRIQKKDYFFHNANSMIRRDIWEDIPFDEKASNIEDRIWGKKVTEEGFHIAYEPAAEVYHHHGLHQGNPKERVSGVVSIIEKIDSDVVNDLPHSLLPENIDISVVIPINDSNKLSNKKENLLNETLKNIRLSKYINSVYIVSNHKYNSSNSVFWIDRRKIKDASKLSIDNLLFKCLGLIESSGSFPALIMYINYEYLFKLDRIDELILERQFNGYDTVFPGYEDYGNYWVQTEDSYEQIDTSLNPRSERVPSFSSLYGQGCLTSASNIRKGKLVDGKIGILHVKEFKYTLRFNRSSIRGLVEEGIINLQNNNDS